MLVCGGKSWGPITTEAPEALLAKDVDHGAVFNGTTKALCTARTGPVWGKLARSSIETATAARALQAVVRTASHFVVAGSDPPSDPAFAPRTST